MKHKVVEENGLYMVLCKKAWYTRWKYARDKKTPALVLVWKSKRAAQSYINFLPKQKIEIEHAYSNIKIIIST
jgi:hypothetical protein